MILLKYLKDINIHLLILDTLFLIISFLFFAKKKSSQRIKDLFIIIYTLINLLLFKHLNTFFNDTFNYLELSIKSYLLSIVFTYIIFLYTFNRKNINKIYKLFNYVLFTIINIILMFNIYNILTIKIDYLPKINLENNNILNNISIIIIINYLVLIAIIYIINNLKLNRVKKENNKTIIQETKPSTLLSIEELLNYNKNNSLYINGIDCSIIFNDSNKENIIKNYQILTNDIEAKMVNGYTLNENIMLKNICEKLNTNNLFEIKIDNFNILNKISVEEYELLKKLKNY